MVSLSQQLPSTNKFIPAMFLFVGVSCMIVAGYFLIEGLLQFGGSAAAKRMLIVAGVLFQITESLCFISSAALANHSLTWRHSMFLLGSVLFCFSIAVMTFAQKAALETGEAQAAAIDERRNDIREQLSSLDELIASYRLNAEKQSKSIYGTSRQLGQDSINKATELAKTKMEFSQKLFKLNESRRQTSLDFFEKLQQITGLEATQTEFWFLFSRSFLLEICGIMLMSFGAYLFSIRAAINTQQNQPKNRSTTKKRSKVSKKKKPNIKSEKIRENKLKAAYAGGNNVSLLRPVANLEPNKELTEQPPNDDLERYAERKVLESYAEKIAALYQSSRLKTLSREDVQKSLQDHHEIQIDQLKAERVVELVKRRLGLY
jgi:hypothetical protein